MNKLFKYIVFTCLFLGVIMSIVNCIRWKDNIYNPANSPYVVEVKFNTGLSTILQSDFDERYLNN